MSGLPICISLNHRAAVVTSKRGSSSTNPSAAKVNTPVGKFFSENSCAMREVASRVHNTSQHNMSSRGGKGLAATGAELVLLLALIPAARRSLRLSCIGLATINFCAGLGMVCQILSAKASASFGSVTLLSVG